MSKDIDSPYPVIRNHWVLAYNNDSCVPTYRKYCFHIPSQPTILISILCSIVWLESAEHNIIPLLVVKCLDKNHKNKSFMPSIGAKERINGNIKRVDESVFFFRVIFLVIPKRIYLVFGEKKLQIYYFCHASSVAGAPHLCPEIMWRPECSVPMLFGLRTWILQPKLWHHWYTYHLEAQSPSLN